MNYNGFSIDIEADNLTFGATKIWTMHLVDLDSEARMKINPFKDPEAKAKLEKWLDRYDTPNICFHNGLGFDIFVLMFLLDVEYSVGPDTFMGNKVNFVDTFYLSMYLNPDRDRHGIEYFGKLLGYPKMDFRQALIDAGALDKDAPDGAEFLNYHPIMEKYCEKDTEIGKRTFIYLINQWIDMYGDWGDWPSHFKAGQKAFYLMSCQELSGWKFDIEGGKKLAVRIQGMMEEIRAEVEPKLPPRALKKTEEKDYKMPAKPYKANGEYSAQWGKFIEKHKGVETPAGNKWIFYGKEYRIEANQILDIQLPMEMANQDQMKDWFLESGWKPTLWNVKKDANGKAMRDPKTRQLIQTSPKLQEAGRLCPNLEEMEGPIVKQVVKWLSLRNRLSVLTGWLENPRLDYDGRIGAGRTGIAATHRQKHKVVVNVPKADPKVLLGHEFRSLWIAEDGWLIAAGDAAALEGRVQGHYCVPMETQALTKDGWKTYDELTIGELILAYNPVSKKKEWTPLLEKHTFKNVETFKLENNNFKVRATANHRWYVEKRDTATSKYYDCVVETKDLTTNCNIITNAPMEDYSGNLRGIFDGKYGVNWVSRILSKGLPQVESFVEGYLIADGNYNNQNAYSSQNPQELGKGRWRFAQNLGEHFEVMLTCGYVAWNGYLNVSYRKTPKNTMGIVTFNKKSFVSMQKMKVESYGFEDVWCPKTKFGTWVMRQGNVITITGNTYKYDGGATADELLKGDVHSKNAYAFYKDIHEEVAALYNSPDFNKDDPRWKPYRNPSKNGYYAIMYGAAAPKVASTLKIPEKYGKIALDAFWEANPGTKMLKDNLEAYWQSRGESKYLPAIDGRILLTRKKSALLNTIFQSCGGIVMDYAGCYMDRWLGKMHWDDKRRPYYVYKGYKVRRIGYFHDEMEFECEAPIAKEISELIEKSIATAGEHLKIQVPLVGEGKVGPSWCEVH